MKASSDDRWREGVGWAGPSVYVSAENIWQDSEGRWTVFPDDLVRAQDVSLRDLEDGPRFEAERARRRAEGVSPAAEARRRLADAVSKPILRKMRDA